jgi:hypothetical protein
MWERLQPRCSWHPSNKYKASPRCANGLLHPGLRRSLYLALPYKKHNIGILK